METQPPIVRLSRTISPIRLPFIVHVQNGDSLEFLERTNVELQARPHLSPIQVAVFHVAFGIEDQAYIGTETKVRIHFWENGVHGCLSPHGS